MKFEVRENEKSVQTSEPYRWVGIIIQLLCS